MFIDVSRLLVDPWCGPSSTPIRSSDASDHYARGFQSSFSLLQPPSLSLYSILLPSRFFFRKYMIGHFKSRSLGLGALPSGTFMLCANRAGTRPNPTFSHPRLTSWVGCALNRRWTPRVNWARWGASDKVIKIGVSTPPPIPDLT